MQERGRSEEVAAGPPGSRGGSKKKGASRDSSVSSLGREVRCGCQYFQTDSLLPERVNPVGRPPSRTSNMAAQIGDHEYEPISPPPTATRSPVMRRGEAMELEVEEALGVSKRRGSESSIDSRERRFLRIPLDDDLVLVPGDGDDEDEAMASRELGDDKNGDVDRERSTQELQSELEDRYFAATPTTTASRTDCEFNTSQMDSSGLEDLPLKRDARKKKMTEMTSEQKQSQARGFQQRLRSQAGRIRTKLRNIRKPNFTMPERPKFNLPERPKFNLPDRPKFNLPERPKFNFPDRPKFNLPERPKFSMPERPKFNFPQRPKLSMPSMARKQTSSTRRPLRDRSQNLSTESEASSRKKMFDFDFRTYPRIFDRKSRHSDYATSSPKSSRTQTPPPDMPFRKKGPVGSRWVHRFTDIKYADDENMPSGSEEGREYPERREEDNERAQKEEYNKKEELNGKEQMEISDERDREQVDEERPESRHTESTTAFHDKDYDYEINIDDNKSSIKQEIQVEPSSLPESDRVEMSSNSSDRRHAGVIEEIDSDEFFLREKGLSQEDVDVGRYLTSEIRDAFRSPTNALSQMENYDYYDEDEDAENLGQQYRSTPDREPSRPARTRSLRPSRKSPKTDVTTPADEVDPSSFYNTFPPTRPKRNRHVSQPQERDAVKERVDEVPKETEEEFDDEDQAQFEEGERDFESQEMEFEERPVSTENLKQSVPSFTYTDDQDVLKGQSMEEDEEEVPISNDQWQEDNNMNEIHPPCPPKRRKQSSRKESIPESLCNGHYTRDDWLENLESEIMAEEVMALRMESDYIIPASPAHEYYDLPPVPPKRGHRRSSRGTSLADEDRTSRCASSLPSERDHAVEDELVSETYLAEISGYAVVDKHLPKKPERPRRPKPPRPPAPTRKKRSSGHGGRGSYFYSLPRRAPPVRPLRNYSTLGPSRPPRRERYIEPEYAEQDNKSESYIEMEDDHFEQSHLESHGSNRDLQSGDVIEKMKGRPLPPPPRPPRKAREGKEQQDEQIESEEAQVITSRMEDVQQHIEQLEQEPESPVNEERAAMAALSDAQFYSQQGITQTQSDIQQQKDELIRRLSEEQNEELMRRLSEDQQELISRLHEEQHDVIPQEIPEEVSVSTQTDPLPDDYCVEGFEEDEPQLLMVTHTDAFTEMMVQEREQTPVEESPVPVVPPPRRNSKINRELALLKATETSLAESASPKVECPVIIPETPYETIPEVLPRHEVDHPPPSMPPPITHTTTIIERPVTVLVTPDSNTEIEVLRTQRLQVVELDVERLNVGEIQAQKIVVSDIDGMSMQVAELSSKSGNLVVNGIEFPTGFLQDLYDSFPTPVQPAQPITVPQTASMTPTVPTPVSETSSPSVVIPQIPIQSVHIPETLVPSVSVSKTLVPSTSVPETLVPSTSVSETLVPSTSVLETLVPSTAIPEILMPSISVPQTPVSSISVPQTPVSSVYVPQTLVPCVPVPQTPAPVSSTARIAVLPTSEVTESTMSTTVPTASTMESLPHLIQQSFVTIPSNQGQPLSFQPQLVQVPISMSSLHQVTMQSPLMSPMYQTGSDPLHSYVPDYIPTSIPMSVRVPSRQRSHAQRELESEEEMISLVPSSTRRRRHHISKPTPRYSTDEEEEEEYSSFRPPSRRHQPRQGSEPSVMDLGRQLVQACHGFTMRATSQLLNYITPQQQEGEDKRRDLQIALCILLVLVAGLILLGFGSGKTFHYHHWDYHFPPQQ